MVVLLGGCLLFGCLPKKEEEKTEKNATTAEFQINEIGANKTIKAINEINNLDETPEIDTESITQISDDVTSEGFKQE
jgi:hypothetical protein